MNTLSRAHTAQLFPHSETYLALRIHWSRLVNSEHKHNLSAAHLLLYLALLGKDWRKAFTPVTNTRKLANGAFYNWKLFHALATLHLPAYQDDLLAPFNGLVTPEMLGQIRRLIPARVAHVFKPVQFLGGAFPFEAYADMEGINTASTQEKINHVG